MHDVAHRETQKAVNAAHPLGIAARQVVVYGNDVYAFAGQPIQIAGQRGHQRFAFAGFHFRNLAAVQDDAANQLHIEMPHIQHAAAGFATNREGFD